MGHKEELRTEMKRRSSARMRMLDTFKKQGELTTAEINRFGTGCSSRIKELRKEGHVIVATYERPGVYRYTYLGNKTDE